MDNTFSKQYKLIKSETLFKADTSKIKCPDAFPSTTLHTVNFIFNNKQNYSEIEKNQYK